MCNGLLRRLEPAMRFAAVVLPLAALTAGAHWAGRPAPQWGELHSAARAGNALAVWELLSRGKADVNAVDTTGDTPLHAAAMSGDLDTIELLLDCGADPNAIDRQGDTPLSCATQVAQVDAARLLLDRGADPCVRNALGRTALDTAALLDEVALIGPLLARGADPQALDGGLTPLNIASNEHHPEFVRELVRTSAALRRPPSGAVCLARRQAWF